MRGASWGGSIPLIHPVVAPSDIPVSPNITIAIFADECWHSFDGLTFWSKHIISKLTNNCLNEIFNWLNSWKNKVNKIKSAQVTFILKSNSYAPIQLNNMQIPFKKCRNSLALIQLDRKLATTNLEQKSAA